MIAQIENKMVERLEYLDKDIVRKQRKRFNILEEKVKIMVEQKSISGGNKTLDMKKLHEAMGTNDGLDEVDDYWGIVQFDSDEEEQLKVYQYLWISEKFFLQGMCAFLALSQ